MNPIRSYKRSVGAVVFTCVAVMVWLTLPQLSFNQVTAHSEQTKKKPEIIHKGTERPGRSPFKPNGPLALLYDQTGNAGIDSIVSQNFESDFDDFDAEAADDFIVPAGSTWHIQQVVALGIYFNGPGPADSVNVTFYANSGSVPGAPICFYSNLTPIDTAGDFSIILGTECVLTGGHYWVGVQANMNFDPNGEWGWDEQTVQTNFESVWRNPGGGFGTSCSSFQPRVTTCGVGGAPDLGFQLFGTEVLGFDICIEDNSNGNFLLLNSTTGAYQFTSCSTGFTTTGTGTFTVTGCTTKFSATGSATVKATIDTCNHTATALVTVTTNRRVTAYNITDSDTTNNSCSCE